jgi:hypothetical protein
LLRPFLDTLLDAATASYLPATIFWNLGFSPEADQINFVSRVRVPLLVIERYWRFPEASGLTLAARGVSQRGGASRRGSEAP